MKEATSAVASSAGGSGSGHANVAGTSAAAAPIQSPGGTGAGTGGSRSGEEITSSSSSSTSSSGTAGRQPSTSATPPTRTLGDVMREPSTTRPDVVVLETITEDRPPRQKGLNPKEDLWLTTADGRYNSSIIPLRVGTSPDCETFYVHKHILIRHEYFEKALCGGFLEAETQSMDFPEEVPAIFHFLVAYFYEGRYEPIKPVASVLVPDEKGKTTIDGIDPGAESDASSTSSINSDASVNNNNNANGGPNQNPAVRERRRRERQRRREDRHFERMRQKHPGLHRPSCNCPQCISASGPPCWSCRAPRAPPPPPPPATYPGPLPVAPAPPVVVYYDRPQDRRRHNGRRHRHAPAPASTPPQPRITGPDLSTWLLAYELDLDVYILANKFCLYPFMKLVARSIIDLFESAGSDASCPQVLYLCNKIYAGLPESDPLLKMIFARVGFLQPWRGEGQEEANEWLVAHPEIASLLLMEMAARRSDAQDDLPSMESLDGGGAYTGGPQGPFSEWANGATTPGGAWDRANGNGNARQWMMGDGHQHGLNANWGRMVQYPYVHGMWGGVPRRLH
ncbi:hypothetical protein QBC38DRAFT_237721 [Podospora fimiseda]|uniref:BTB domain-containing protein n=1 Tax=Podospora fimiseda TaxID=252190 RepID=A0AAN7BML3_9PEZI|nr:hypothetical protein QBC38DRAFT_237721 [Podospora fimiseda]